jgi:3-deoxy-D-manno-octulosonic-acid transferase
MYELLIRLYFVFIRFAGLFNTKAALFSEGRRNWKEQLKKIPSGVVWFHCSSLGEFEDGRIILEQFRKDHPQDKVLLTFFSPSGFEAKKNTALADHVLYLPADTAANADHFVEHLRPRLVLFVRNDIWPNYLQALKRREIPVVMLSFSLSANSAFLKKPQSRFYKKAFVCFDRIFVQNKKTAVLLEKEFSLSNVRVTGNMRINAICSLAAEAAPFPEISAFVGDAPCIICGSALAADEQMFLALRRKMQSSGIKWIITPHEIDRDRIVKYCNSDSGMIAYSGIASVTSEHDLLWIDNIGMLSRLYRYADLAFIGGGFDKIGIHNILEPAVYGCPVCFGPNHRSYEEAKDMLRYGGAEVVRSADELEFFMRKYLSDSSLLKEMKRRNSEYVFARIGDKQAIMDEIAALKKQS